MEDGKTIQVERASTAFGPVSLLVKSELSEGEVIAGIDLPRRGTPKRAWLRVRVPEGWRVTSARVGSQILTADEQGTVDISALQGKVTIRFSVKKH